MNSRCVLFVIVAKGQGWVGLGFCFKSRVLFYKGFPWPVEETIIDLNCHVTISG